MTGLRRLKPGKSARDVDVTLRSLVRRTYASVPLYRRLWRESGVAVSSFRGAIDLPTLPVVTKKSMLSEPLDARLFAGVDPRRTIRRSTSGTSGAPIEVHMSSSEFRFRQMSLFLAMWNDARRALPLTVVEAGAWIPPDGSGTVLVRRTGLATIVYISRRIPVEDQVKALLKTRPTVLTGSPTSLDVIAAELERAGACAPRPRAIVTRGEVLHSRVRQLLERAFRCLVVDYYNAQEVGNIARQCPRDPSVFHVNRNTCCVEIVDADGRPLPVGREGVVVVTGLYNQTMPFIRYVLGDRASMIQDASGRCCCGHRGPLISPPVGRDDDLITLPDGRVVSPRVIDDLVIGACRSHGLESSFTRAVREYQVVQESPFHITVLFEAAAPVPIEVIHQLRGALSGLHPHLCCDVENVSTIDIGESGKRRRVVSKIL